MRSVANNSLSLSLTDPYSEFKVEFHSPADNVINSDLSHPCLCFEIPPWVLCENLSPLRPLPHSLFTTNKTQTLFCVYFCVFSKTERTKSALKRTRRPFLYCYRNNKNKVVFPHGSVAAASFITEIRQTELCLNRHILTTGMKTMTQCSVSNIVRFPLRVIKVYCVTVWGTHTYSALNTHVIPPEN